MNLKLKLGVTTHFPELSSNDDSKKHTEQSMAFSFQLNLDYLQKMCGYPQQPLLRPVFPTYIVINSAQIPFLVGTIIKKSDFLEPSCIVQNVVHINLSKGSTIY